MMGISKHLGPEIMREEVIWSKTFVTFANFSCTIFWAQNVPVPPNHTLLTLNHNIVEQVEWII